MHRIQEMRVPYYERVCKFQSTSVKVHNETKVSGHFVVVGFHRRKGITIVWVRVDDYIHHLTQLGGLISVYGDWTGGHCILFFQWQGQAIIIAVQLSTVLIYLP